MTRLQSFSRRDLLKLSLNLGVVGFAGGQWLHATPARAAQARAVLGHFGGANPQMFGKATQGFEKAFGADVKTEYASVSSGAQVLAAIAGNSMDLCNVGSSPMVVGFGQGVKMSMVYVQKTITDSECLIVRTNQNVKRIEDLAGKTIGLPFNTSVHFAMVAALDGAGMKVSDVKLLNIGADAITAAWQRKNIDAAYIWVPVLNTLLDDGGEILLKSGDLAASGTLVFDGIVVRDAFKQAHPELVLAYLQEYARLCDIYRDTPEKVGEVLSPYLNLSPEMALAYTRTFHSLTPQEVASDTWMGLPGATDTGVLHTLHAQAEFLHSAGQLAVVPQSFAPYIDARFVAQMVGN